MDTSKIKEHMEVVGSDDRHVGLVDHMDGQDMIKLAKSDIASGGEHHWIPISYVDRVEDRVILKITAEEAMQKEQAVKGS